MRKNNSLLVLTSFSLLLLLFSGCASSTQHKKEKSTKVAETIANFKKSDPGIKTFFKKAYGYAIFPTVRKGGITFGGAYGKGKVYEKEKLVGYSSLSQFTFGLQLGVQAYSEIIFFKDKDTLDDFKKGNFEFGAQASAVAITSGASANAGPDSP